MSADRPTPYRYVIEALLFLTYAVFGLSWIAITPLMDDLQSHFHVSRAQLGLITTMVSFAKVVAPLVTGLLAVRIGIKRTILLGSVCISFAVLAPYAPNFETFLGARFIFGIGGAVVVTLLGPMVMQWFPAGERPLVNAFNNVAVNTGITITLFATVPLAARLGWQHTLLAYGALSVGLMLAWAVLGRDVEAPAPASSPAGPAAAPAPVGYGDVWRLRETWLIAVCFSGPLALYLALNTWLPKYYVEAFHMSKAMASSYTGLFNLVGIPTAILAGFAAQKLGVRRPFIIGAGVVMGFAAFGMFLSPNPVIITIAAVALGIALFTYVGPLFTIPMELPGLTPQHVSLMMGTVFSVAYTFSSLSPVLVGWIRDAQGSYVAGLAIWAAFSWVLAVGGYLLPETGPRGEQAGQPEAAPATEAA